MRVFRNGCVLDAINLLKEWNEFFSVESWVCFSSATQVVMNCWGLLHPDKHAIAVYSCAAAIISYKLIFTTPDFRGSDKEEK